MNNSSNLFILSILVFLFFADVFAFDSQFDPISPGNNDQFQLGTPSATGLVDDILEQAINPDQYIIGPGDYFAVNVWVGYEQQLILKVNPEGILTIPSVGDMNLSGLTLTKAKRVIDEQVKKVYRGSSVSIFLYKLRRFRVAVTGIVIRPGVYRASAADRVSVIIENAGGFIIRTEEERLLKQPKTQSDVTPRKHIEKEEEYKPASSRRNILLIKASGDTIPVDILRFYRTSDLRNNPFVSEGDVIYIPPMVEDIGLIEVSGAVKYPDKFEFMPGDRVADVIAVSCGLQDNADVKNAALSRCIDSSQDFKTIRLDLSAGSPDWELKLQPDDRLFIRSLFGYHERYNIRLVGEVEYPGYYPIVDNETTLFEIIERAGGFTQWANLLDAEVIRIAEEEENDPEFERLKLIPLFEMTEMEYEYFKTRLREKSKVVVDFQTLFEEQDLTQDILLRDQDYIYIPRIKETVKVAGQVIRPGLIDWQPAKNYKYYIEQAGDYAYHARKNKVRIIRASSGKWIKPSNNTVIYIGDTIFVPEKPERDYWVLFKDALLVASQMVTIIVLINSLNK